MSDLQTREVQEIAGDDVALVFHLQSRLYPPPHEDFYPAIYGAIAAARAGEWDKVFILPNGLVKDAGEIVASLRLECFVESAYE